VQLLGIEAAEELTTAATSVDLGEHGRRGGEVMVLGGLARSRANCTCGWDGGRRFWRAGAVLDAHLHAAGGCELRSPLVFR
jgi:hypothetical protein